jgi:hypothetical protein
MGIDLNRFRSASERGYEPVALSLKNGDIKTGGFFNKMALLFGFKI